MPKRQSSREFQIVVTVTNSMYSFPVCAATLQDALDKGKEIVSKTSIPKIKEIECDDEHSEVTGIWELNCD